MDISIREMAQKLREHDNFCIVYHIRADGDCTGSSFALCLALQSIGRLNTFIKSSGRMKIESILRDSFHFTCDNRIVTGIIMLNDLETAGVLDSDIEGINSLVEQIEGVRIGVTIRELPDGRMRCSMRSNGNISVNEIAKDLGGGGHTHATCAELDMSAAQARVTVERICGKYLEEDLVSYE